MKVTQAYRFALDPTPGQERALRSHAGASRFAWNWALAKCTERYEAEGCWYSGAELHRLWNAEKKADPALAWWGENSKCAYQEAFRDLDRALRDFIKSGKGKRLGFPRFKKRGRCRDSPLISHSQRLSGTLASVSEANAGREAAAAAAVACAAAGTAAAVLVEGESDRAALLTLAGRTERDLDAARVAVVPMGGATNIGHFASALGPPGLGLRLAGLYDAGEESQFRRGLVRAGLNTGADRAGLERAGFHVCVADLEDELIRALGVSAVERVIEFQGEARRLRALRTQPAQLGRSPERQLRRFIAGRSGAKVRYAAALAGALDPGQLPRPLERLLAQLP